MQRRDELKATLRHLGALKSFAGQHSQLKAILADALTEIERLEKFELPTAIIPTGAAPLGNVTILPTWTVMVRR